MITLVFEYGALDKNPVTIQGEWFQMTYDELRDSDDNEVAYRNANGLWVKSGEEYSDIIIGSL